RSRLPGRSPRGGSSRPRASPCRGSPPRRWASRSGRLRWLDLPGRVPGTGLPDPVLAVLDRVFGETIWNVEPSHVSNGSVGLPAPPPNPEHPMPAANRLPWALVLTAVLAATAPVPLSAQLGGLARKAKAALSGEKVATP